MVRLLSVFLAAAACSSALATDLASLKHRVKHHQQAAAAAAVTEQGCVDLVPRRISNDAKNGLRVEVCNKGTCSSKSEFSLKITNLENKVSISNNDCGVEKMQVPPPQVCFWSKYFPDNLLESSFDSLWGVQVQVDPQNELGVQETNTANNVKKFGVDLVVGEVKGSTEGFFNIEYCNDGDLSVKGSFRIRLENSKTGKLVISQPIPSIPPPHQCDHFSFPCNMVTDSCISQNDLLVTLDTENAIREINEENNFHAVRIV